MYDIEDRTRELSAPARVSLRQREAEPVLDRIEAYLAELARRALPRSALGMAVSYAQNQWRALRRYTADGRLTIDNNVSERTLRHQAIGRKNWLFLGSSQAGPRAAILFTILAGAKRHRIEPWVYMRELLLRLHADDSRLDEMLPDRWAADHPESILTYRLDESSQKAARQRERRQRRRTRRQATYAPRSFAHLAAPPPSDIQFKKQYVPAERKQKHMFVVSVRRGHGGPRGAVASQLFSVHLGRRAVGRCCRRALAAAAFRRCSSSRWSSLHRGCSTIHRSGSISSS